MMILKVYSAHQRACHHREKVILKQLTEADLAPEGFPRFYSSKQNPHKTELLMECLGQNLKDAEKGQRYGIYPPFKAYRIIQ
jgi:hypothetical protein